MEITKDILVSLVVRMFPYAQHLENFDTTSESDSIRFTWRGHRFRVSKTLMVETIHDGCLHGDNLSILAEGLIKRGWRDVCSSEAKVSRG